jgi:hypothetical protein
MPNFEIDQGVRFGYWDNDTSRLLYRDIMPLCLNGVDTSGRVADFGGANGLLKAFIPQSISIDYDSSKNPDIVDDILVHKGDYDLIVLRYVLHYLDDKKVSELFNHIRSFHKGRILVIQFVNEDLESKTWNSVNEVKWFRNEKETRVLLETDWEIMDYKSIDYFVSAQFYRDRLNHPNPKSHRESIAIYYLDKKQ